MAHPKCLHLAIAYFSAVAYSLWTLYIIYVMVAMNIILRQFGKQHMHRDDITFLNVASGLVITFMVLDIIKCIAMVIASVFLILGINKQRHQYMAPWMYMTAIALILTILGLATSKVTKAGEIVFTILVIAIQLAMWYPINVLYRELRNPGRILQQPTHFPPNVVHVTYSQAPNNQAGAYPPAAYGQHRL